MNLRSLNQLRASLSYSTFSFRPHAGEAGDVNHLVATFLVAESINHGILLRKQPSLQFLYYLAQIGIAMSPISNNKLFLTLDKSPFPTYFAQGGCVDWAPLSSSLPLRFLLLLPLPAPPVLLAAVVRGKASASLLVPSPAELLCPVSAQA